MRVTLKQKRLRKTRIIILLSIILLVCLSIWSYLTFFYYPDALINVDTTYKQIGTHETTKKKENGKTYVSHYPKVEAAYLNTFTQEVLEKYATLMSEHEGRNYLVDYRIQKSHDLIDSIEYILTVDDVLISKDKMSFLNDGTPLNLETLINKKGIGILSQSYPDIDMLSTAIFVDKDTFLINDQELSLDTLAPYLKITIGPYEAVIYQDPNDKYVAITFDDGPHFEFTEEILDVLDNYNATATFFTLGLQVEKYPEIVKETYDRGHQIANHSYSHPSFYNLTKDEYMEQINKTNTLITDITGSSDIMMIRAPYGNVDETIMNESKGIFIGWSVDTEDWRDRNPKRICESVSNDSFDGSIILMHDIHKSTKESLNCILDNLTSQGYKIVSVETLMEIRDYSFVGPQNYHSFPLKD